MIVRDVWAYHLSLSKLPPKPDSNSTTAEDTVGEETKENEKDDNKSDDEKSDKDDDSKSDSSSEPGIDKELLEEMSERSSSSEGEDDNTGGLDAEGYPKKASKKPLRASDTLLCLIIGLWIIRYPIINADIERLAFGFSWKSKADMQFGKFHDYPLYRFRSIYPRTGRNAEQDQQRHHACSCSDCEVIFYG
jgi:hypothetical protein